MLHRKNCCANEKKLARRASPLALADLYDSSAVRLGLEYSTAKIGVFADAASYVDWLPATKQSPKGFAVDLGVKYYFMESTKGRKY